MVWNNGSGWGGWGGGGGARLLKCSVVIDRGKEHMLGVEGGVRGCGGGHVAAEATTAISLPGGRG